MKKIIYLAIFSFSFLIFGATPTYAVEEPYFDSNFNQNNGAFYANGTPITIEADNGQTIIKWDNKEEKVPNTVMVFGGGPQGTHFENSNITMNAGTVAYIAGGGISKDENHIANVKNANITINGGTISSGIVGGGILNAHVNNATITINGGNTESVIAGGLATVLLDSQLCHVGSATQPQNSPNRVNTTSVTINNITMPLPHHSGGSIYGGAFGYAFVGNSELTINDGEMSKTSITAGGADDYVEKSDVTITGGTIKLYQSVNRGTVKDLTTIVTGGSIEEFSVGTHSSGVATGKLNKCDTYLLYGTINNLEAGKIDSTPLIIDKENYKVIQTYDVTINSSSIPEDQRITVDYNISLYPSSLILNKGFNQHLDLTVYTNPEEYENIFSKIVKWESDNADIASVSKNGVVTGINTGNADITAKCLQKSQTSHITVEEKKAPTILLIIFFPLLLLVIILIFIIIFLPVNSI